MVRAILAAHLQRGRQAENLAARLVQSEQYEIVGRNVSFPCGEIDLIAKRQQEIVFVEVRSRATTGFGSPEETVNKAKQRKLIAAAELWLQKNDPSGNYYCRFDVIGFTGDSPRWIKNAFGTT